MSAPEDPQFRPTFERLCSVADALDLVVELHLGVPGAQLFRLAVSDGAEGGSEVACADVAVIDLAAHAVLEQLAREGILEL